MILYLLLGFFMATIGLAILNGIGEIISAIIELIKAAISVKIMKYNQEINRLNNSMEKSNTRAIGFATTFEEEEEYE